MTRLYCHSVGLVFVAVLLASAGCGDSGQSTPLDTLLKFAVAYNHGDKGDMLACVEASDEERACLETLIDYSVEYRRFREAMKKAYGESGWEEFNDKGNIRLTLDVKKYSRLKRVKIALDEKTGMAVVKLFSDESVTLARREGKWLIVLNSYEGFPDPEKREKAEAVFGGIAALLRDCGTRIGKTGVTPETLDEEISTKVLELYAANGVDVIKTITEGIDLDSLVKEAEVELRKAFLDLEQD